ncbi:sporulation protein YqfC [Salipaludibacillus sp. CF4.18]|uniref:sporulation protein YqfC n=1 Tax=Salipaludibacillus sp. CF4.18 TaxID=3373081 RepID=UPI003EE64D4F
MKQFHKWVKKWMVNYLDLPADVVMDLPRITLVGNLHIYIENHQGVLLFTDKELKLALTDGELLIRGEQFIIKKIHAEEILLEGKIKDVHYLDRNRD